MLPAPAEELYEMYLDPALHGAFTGHPVTIAAQSGAEFRAFDGQLTGRILATVQPSLIVQSWRSTNFKPDDEDSTLILAFSDESTGGRVNLVHVGVPDQDYGGVSEGWETYYWGPWREYLEQRGQAKS
jgi:activator of HSP90 ATPase